jgi:hypothetical protein
MDYLVIGCRCIIAVVFLASTASKLRGSEAFGRFLVSLRDFGLPSSLARPVGVAVVAIEGAIPPLVILPLTTPVGLLAATSLLGVFTAAILRSLRRGMRAPCRCFGSTKAPLGASHVVRNTLLTTVAITGAVGMVTGPPTELHPAGVVMALAVGLVLAGLIIAFDDLVGLFAQSSSIASRGAS